MKKITTLLPIAMLLQLATLSAQKSTVTFSAGLHNSNTKTNGGTSELLNSNPIASLYLGLGIDRKLDDKLSVETGISYAQKGFEVGIGTDGKVLGMNLPIGATAKTEINYLTVPALLKLNLDLPKSYLTPYIGVGPSVSYAVSGQLETRVQAGFFDLNVGNTPIDFTSDNYNRFQVNGQVVMGADIAYGAGNIKVEAGYGHSFTDLVSSEFIIDAGGKHHGWNLSIGYGIRF